jgi:hypothetical protein
MKMRSLMMGAIATGLASGIAGAALADPVQIGVSTNPNSYGVAEIKIDGPSADGVYTEIRNETLDYIVSVRGDRPGKAKSNGRLEIQFRKESPLSNEWAPMHGVVHSELTKDWKAYKLSVPYVDPWSTKIVNQRISPIDVCNDNLTIRKKDPDRRAEMLKKGLSFLYHDAYKLRGYVEYPMKGSALFGNDIKSYDHVEAVPVKITCMALDRPRPRTKTTTTGAPGPKGKPMPPTISEVSLRVEPSNVVQDGKFLCPSQLRLYGQVQVIRKFTGKSIFVGPHYLSPITTLDFQAEGTRNVVGVYKMDWHQMGGLAAQSNAEPKKQKLTFRFNVSNKDGKVLDSAEKSVVVSCKKIKSNAPTAGNGMTVNPAN